MLLHSPQQWPARQPDSPAHVTRRVSAARTLGTPHLSRRTAHRPVPPCWRPVASARPDPNNACRTALDLPRQIEELEKKLEAERQCAPHPAVPRACGPGGAGLRRSTPSPPRPAPARAGPPPPNPRPTILHKRTPRSPQPCGPCAGSGRRSRRSSLRSRPSSSRPRPSDEPPLLLRRYSGEHLFRP